MRRQEIERANEQALNAALQESLRTSSSPPGILNTSSIPISAIERANQEALEQALRISAMEANQQSPSMPMPPVSRSTSRSQPISPASPPQVPPQAPPVSQSSQQATPPWVSIYIIL